MIYHCADIELAVQKCLRHSGLDLDLPYTPNHAICALRKRVRPGDAETLGKIDLDGA